MVPTILEGFRHKHLPVFSVQYHPEASPGPHDSRYLFEEFKSLMLQYQQETKGERGESKGESRKAKDERA